MINAWDHLDSCIWGWQGGQLTQKNAEFGQNRPFSEVQGPWKGSKKKNVKMHCFSPF